jgi:diaminopimelate epimerase
MEGLGNDFVVFTGRLSLSPAEIVALCDRRKGIGADGVLGVSKVDNGVAMEYFNADGSPAEMCGNGLRCVARLAVDLGMVGIRRFAVQTPIGPRRVQVMDSQVTAELGPVTLGELRGIGDNVFQIVSVGNPHAVTWVDDLENIPLESVAAELQEYFPAGINLEMATVDSPCQLSMRVWERGVGETAACGTGAVAAAAAGLSQGLTREDIEVTLLGGSAQVHLEKDTSWITGPARLVYEGKWMH